MRKRYDVLFYQAGRYSVTESFDTLAEAKREAREYIKEMRKECRLSASRGFRKTGNLDKGAALWIEHKAFGLECAAYLHKMIHTERDGWRIA